MSKPLRFLSYIYFLLLIVCGFYFIFNAEFTFSFDDFFPQEDTDLDFFKDFVEEFETDDNFFLVALDDDETVFDSIYLKKLKEITYALDTVYNVKNAVSLVTIKYPLKTPFAIVSLPIIHVDEPSKYEGDKGMIMSDERLVRTLIAENMKSSIVSLKIKDGISLIESTQLIEEIDSIVKSYQFDDYHFLGRANFQKEMIAMSSNEITKFSLIAAFLVLLVIIWIFRNKYAVLVSMGAISLSMLGFMAFMGLSGQSFSPLAGLYPILMIIVSTSDIIHLLTKYISELKKGTEKKLAIKKTLRDIGFATLLTSLTTAIGFATLLFSRLAPIKEFGINASVGVILAFITTFLFSAVFFPMLNKEDLVNNKIRNNFWDRILDKIYLHTLNNGKSILFGTIIILVLSAIGISQITTNFRLKTNLPIGEKVTYDLEFFEKEYAGFRPLEFAIMAGEGKKIDDYDVMLAIVKAEEYLKNYPTISSAISYTIAYKSVNKMMHGNKVSAYKFPSDSMTFERYKKFTNLAPKQTTTKLLSKDKTKSRISTRVDDVGAETVQAMTQEIEEWLSENIDNNVATFKLTGTAMLLDKNTFYLRESIIKGLLLAILIVAFLMALLFKNLKLIIISILPNLLPLLVGAAIIGFSGIELEAGLAIVFAISFGIAVDDTIHFLSKYKIELNRGVSIEEALKVTFKETGKAIILTSIILFVGFSILRFSIHPPTRSIGVLIGATLIVALLADLYLIPGLIRYYFLKKKKK